MGMGFDPSSKDRAGRQAGKFAGSWAGCSNPECLAFLGFAECAGGFRTEAAWRRWAAVTAGVSEEEESRIEAGGEKLR
jgi:hypothetical protein